MVVILYFDKNYARWAPLLIRSFNIHEPKCKFCLYTYNLSKSKINKLMSFESVNYIKNETMKFDRTKASRWLYQLVCRKGEFILDTMDRFKNSNLFVSMDVDMILVNNLTNLKNAMISNDLGFVRVGKNKILSGFIAINNTSAAKDFIGEYNKRAMTGFLEHKNDQPVLAKIYEERKDKINCLLLDRTYLDHTSDYNAYIWSAHKTSFGSKDSRYKTYVKEIKKMSRNK